jgi:hypothetical protein
MARSMAMAGLMNSIHGAPALRFDPGGITFTGAVEWEHMFRVTQNKGLLQPDRSSQSAAIDVQVEPAYFEVLPNLELQFPVSFSYNVAGNSQWNAAMNQDTGSILAIYRENWIASLNHVGRVGINPTDPEIQALADRGDLWPNQQPMF